MKLISKYRVAGIFIIFLFFSNNAFPQREFRDDPPREEINKLRKEKLMEKLQIDESTANKFFELFDKNMTKLRSLNREKRVLLAGIEKDLDSPDLEKKLDRLMNIDLEMDNERRAYINELKKILTVKQIVQSIILQRNFTKELRKEVDRHKKKRFQN
jgi:hypothetical protein